MVSLPGELDDAIERARIAVRPIIEAELEGDRRAGDLMDFRFHPCAPLQSKASPEEWARYFKEDY